MVSREGGKHPRPHTHYILKHPAYRYLQRWFMDLEETYGQISVVQVRYKTVATTD